jgi:pimeloyl-ACP methyl ester carboxylesterase
MNKKHIDTERGRVYYWISDRKKDRAIMFTHGVTGDHTLFHRQLDYWDKEYTVIVWDMPLHGESRPYQDFSFLNVAKDMKAILDKEGITHAVMVGQSAGGYAIQAFALKFANMADAFVFIDSTPFGRKYYKKSELFWTNHYSSIAKWYPYGYYCKAAAKAMCRNEEARQVIFDCLQRLGKKGMLEAADAVYKDFPNYEEVHFNCPVLLMLGEYDKTGYIKRYNEQWSKETGYPLVTIPDAAHISNDDNYEFFNEKVDQFLSKF